MRPQRSTIRDVARRAGVAVGTASRALTGSGAVRAETAERVRRAAEALGWRPDPAGRALRSGGFRALGVLAPTLANPVFAEALEGVETRAAARGFCVVVASSRYDPAREDEAVAALAARGVEGLVLTLSDLGPRRLAGAARPGLPFVCLFNQPTAAAASLVTVDSRAAMREVTERLIALGHRRIAFLAGAFVASDRSIARFEGYREVMEATGLPVWAPVEVPFLDEGAAFDAAIDALLRRLARPTALLCSNDLLGLHAVAAARRAGLAVPADLSVVGFDGMPMARIVEPALATVRQPARAMGAAAADLLLDRIAGGPPRRLVLPHEFLPGGTLAPAASDDDALTARDPSP